MAHLPCGGGASGALQGLAYAGGMALGALQYGAMADNAVVAIVPHVRLPALGAALLGVPPAGSCSLALCALCGPAACTCSTPHWRDPCPRPPPQGNELIAHTETLQGTYRVHPGGCHRALPPAAVRCHSRCAGRQAATASCCRLRPHPSSGPPGALPAVRQKRWRRWAGCGTAMTCTVRSGQGWAQRGLAPRASSSPCAAARASQGAAAQRRRRASTPTHITPQAWSRPRTSAPCPTGTWWALPPTLRRPRWTGRRACWWAGWAGLLGGLGACSGFGRFGRGLGGPRPVRVGGPAGPEL